MLLHNNQQAHVQLQQTFLTLENCKQSIASVDHIQNLSNEIFGAITKLLKVTDLKCLSQVSKKYSEVCVPEFWKQKCVDEEIDLARVKNKNYKELWRNEGLHRFVGVTSVLFKSSFPFQGNFIELSCNYKHEDFRGKHLIKMIANKIKTENLFPALDLSKCIIQVLKSGGIVKPDEKMHGIEDLTNLYLYIKEK